MGCCKAPLILRWLLRRLNINYMKYSWATFVILGIWSAIMVMVIGRDNTQPEQMFLFATVATLIISFLGYR